MTDKEALAQHFAALLNPLYDEYYIYTGPVCRNSLPIKTDIVYVESIEAEPDQGYMIIEFEDGKCRVTLEGITERLRDSKTDLKFNNSQWIDLAHPDFNVEWIVEEINRIAGVRDAHRILNVQEGFQMSRKMGLM